ncbi:hypothetical protein N868_12895 [Cellulomonas carbonis T26]|uniref:DUF6318 domain-containing protein n=1 Tax=Cellulomonas carbonis T26 TaxID=947969 RepID=A0A0A0BR69_9CELL|nr:hypothetical protein N868_12895 [Cellulomonas carbonis T26]
MLAAGVVGCSGEPAGEPTPRWTVNPSPSVPEATPTPTEEPITAPERPAEMERMDEVGAVAAAEYFLAVEEYVFRTGDLQQWDKISLADCGFCQNKRDAAVRVYGSGGRYVGAETTTGEPAVVGHDPALNGYAVEIEYSAGPGQELDAAGEVVADLAVGHGFLVLDVMPVNGEWGLLSVAGSEKSAS